MAFASCARRRRPPRRRPELPVPLTPVKRLRKRRLVPGAAAARLRIVVLPPTRMAAQRGKLYVDVTDGWVTVPVTPAEAARIAALPEGLVTLLVRKP